MVSLSFWLYRFGRGLACILMNVLLYPFTLPRLHFELSCCLTKLCRLSFNIGSSCMKKQVEQVRGGSSASLHGSACGCHWPPSVVDWMLVWELLLVLWYGMSRIIIAGLWEHMVSFIQPTYPHRPTIPLMVSDISLLLELFKHSPTCPLMGSSWQEPWVVIGERLIPFYRWWNQAKRVIFWRGNG